MTEQKHDGGPAFPVHGGADPVNDDPRNHTLGGGMSLRDWLAGQAMGALIAGFTADGGDYPHRENTAAWAYAQADAMLAERSKATGAA